MNRDTGRFAFFRQVMTDGITCMFGNPGSSEENLLDALGDPDFAAFKYYLALHEGAAVGMADAYARASAPVKLPGDSYPWRRPALVQLHSYAGLANGLGMMYYAKRGYTPMVVVAGEAGIRYEAMDGQMAADLPAIARPFVKFDHNGPCAWRVVDSRSLLRLVRRAIKTAATPPMGPVFLCLPMDVLDEPATEAIERSFPVASRVAPGGDTVAAAASLLARAERPLILMGDGIAAAGAQHELADVAHQTGAVVWGANSSEVNMAASHPLFGGVLGHMFALESQPITSAADVVLVCGTTLLPEVFPPLAGVFAPGAQVIHFDLNGAEIGKTFPFAIGALCDPKIVLAELAQEVDRAMDERQRQAARERSERLLREKTERQAKALAADAAACAKTTLHVSQFAQELAALLPDNALVFDEALTSSPELMRYLPRPQDIPGHYFQTRAGMLGTGLPGTIGLKIAHPDKAVIGFAGDGGSIATIQALATAARYKIGAKFVVCNNRSYRILKYNLRDYWRTLGITTDGIFPNSFDLSPPNLRFDQLAAAQGVRAMRVETTDQIARTLDAALADPNEPFLIDLVLSPAL
jgi:thiamine pyrophosphate-dependent acetolactate synthase large subunit-like protein